MNVFVRQLVVLSVLWSFCELILPDGKQQRMVRFTLSALVMTALLSAVSGLLGGVKGLEWPAQPVMVQGAEPEGDRIALTAMANQAQRYCEQIAKRAGYEAKGAVYLRENGAVETVKLWLAEKDDEPPLMDGETLRQRLAQALGIEAAYLELFMEKEIDEAGEP
ncbi:MAG: stage III sporulation protein AF [Eubacteriales bacterium]|nr:stage III sporulation protein AF [Eubacteriales bacterium]